nr:MAG TPA: hypothetical protein [Caudoviricetes sp.]
MFLSLSYVYIIQLFFGFVYSFYKSFLTLAICIKQDKIHSKILLIFTIDF